MTPDGLAKRLQEKMLTHSAECIRDQLWFTPLCQCHNILGGDFCERVAAEALAYVREEMLGRGVPTTWLDPLLTGPEAVLKGHGPWAGPDIERLLGAITKRIDSLLESRP